MLMLASLLGNGDVKLPNGNIKVHFRLSITQSCCVFAWLQKIWIALW